MEQDEPPARKEPEEEEEEQEEEEELGKTVQFINEVEHLLITLRSFGSHQAATTSYTTTIVRKSTTMAFHLIDRHHHTNRTPTYDSVIHWIDSNIILTASIDL